ncbi:8758_t:CDS:2 [Entrophospora sp. SA101]|nr:8758_t:CDS:2 [Entrophospora sp. SA101]
MIQLKTVLNVIDNSGALLAECIRVAHGGRYGRIGDPITVVIKRARPIPQVTSQTAASAAAANTPAGKLMIRKGEVRKALIVRTRKETRRPDGRYIRFDDNACVLINNRGEPLGTRILGVIGAELRDKKWGKIVSLAQRTFGHNIVDKIIDFIFYDIVAESKWDGCPAQSIKFRNATQNITRYPDFYAYEENYGYFFNHEYLFLEISNSPWATGHDHIKHVNEDRFRLCKFQKDAHKYVYYILKNKNLKYLKLLLDNIVFISIHFHELKMDINIMDCKMQPFYLINPFQQIDLPLHHLDQKGSIDSLVSLCQSLLILNHLIKENTITLVN